MNVEIGTVASQFFFLVYLFEFSVLVLCCAHHAWTVCPSALVKLGVLGAPILIQATSLTRHMDRIKIMLLTRSSLK
jgi:hypothetical protein